MKKVLMLFSLPGMCQLEDLQLFLSKISACLRYLGNVLKQKEWTLQGRISVSNLSWVGLGHSLTCLGVSAQFPECLRAVAWVLVTAILIPNPASVNSFVLLVFWVFWVFFVKIFLTKSIAKQDPDPRTLLPSHWATETCVYMINSIKWCNFQVFKL